MYQEIHDDLVLRLKQSKDYRFVERRLNIGMALKQLKASNRVKMRDLIRSTGLKRSCLNTLMQIGEMNTSYERFLKIIEGLRISEDEFVRIARETARYNFYPISRDEKQIFKYKGYDVEVYSPPSFSSKDFFWCLIRIHPGKEIADLVHETMEQVAGFVTHGHLKFIYAEGNHTIHTNQSFFFDPKIKHRFQNQASTETAEFYLLYKLRPEPTKKRAIKQKPEQQHMGTGTLIQEIRKELSPDPDRLLPLPALAALSGIDVNALMHQTYRDTKIVPFEKIDLLANLTDYSFEHMIQKARGRYKGWVRIFTDHDKTVIDLSLRNGVVFSNHTGMGVGKRKFSIMDATFASRKKEEARKQWQYVGVGFMGIAVQRGFIGVQYGKQPLQVLRWGETLYLNVNVEVTLFNLLTEEEARASGESEEAKAIVFSSPALL